MSKRSRNSVGLFRPRISRKLLDYKFTGKVEFLMYKFAGKGGFAKNKFAGKEKFMYI
jgi:hypothetical protein